MRTLIVSPIPTHPAHSGNNRRVHNLSVALRGAGHDVHFALLKTPHTLEMDLVGLKRFWGDRLHIFHNLEPSGLKSKIVHKVRRMLRPLAGATLNIPPSGEFRLPLDDWFHPWWEVRLARLCRRFRFHAVIAEYIFISRALNYAGAGARRILDTHDRFGGRAERICEAGIDAPWWSTTHEVESAALSRADYVLAIQDEEAELFRKMTNAAVIRVGHLMPEMPKAASPVPQKSISLVLASNYGVNVEGIRWFIERVFSRVHRLKPDAELWVAGGASTAFRSAQYEGVRFLGRVGELEPLYRACQVAVNPVRFGTGVAIKALEALSFGRGLISTAAGVRGLNLGPEIAVASDDPDELVDGYTRALSNPAWLSQAAEAAHLFAVKYHAEQLSHLEQAVGGMGHAGGIPSRGRWS